MKIFNPHRAQVSGKVTGAVRFAAALFALVAIFICPFARAADAPASGATISTDLADYPPGGTVVITGSGFLPGETVRLQIVHLGDGIDDDLTNPAHSPWDVIAGANGGIQATWVVPTTGYEVGATLLLTSQGMTSGRSAFTTFTDGNVRFTTTGLPNNINVTVNYSFPSAGLGSSITFSTGSSGNGNSNPAIGATPNGSNFYFAFPATIVVGSTTYNLVSTSDSSPIVIGNPAVTIFGNYAPACIPPSITFCPPSVSVNCAASTDPASTGTATASGTAPTVGFSDSINQPNANCANKIITRTWTATNACGTVTCQQVITVVDNTAPVIAALPATSTIYCPATPVFAVATATDACGSAFTLTSADVTTPGACAGSYSVKRTWTATDACGNTSTASQIINVVDNTAPVIAALPAPSSINCLATPVFAVATATDACGSAFTLTSADVTTPGACAGSYSVTRIWTATDACGNTSTASQIINVVDNTAPVIAALPATSTIYCPATPVFAVATATDACGSAFTLTSADVTTPGACAGSYSVTRTWTATDACGNTSTASQIINVVDNTAPVIAALPATSTIYCPAAPVFAVATATDACGSAFTLTSADVTTPGACAGSYSVTRTWTATDACGNTSTASQIINVVDNTAPVIAALPVTSTINCPATPVFAVATAIDACGSAFTLTSADVTTPGACAGSYSVTRTWTATDACGNTSTASQIINVVDNTAPVIADLPATSTIYCPATPVFAVATATDACGSAFTLTSADVTTPGACAGSYSVTRTWTATDACGNTSTASQIINVVDNTAPVIADLPATSTIYCPATPVFAVATATDACGSAFTLTSADVTTPGACAGSYSVKRTWTATDACGNTSTASQIINVVDNTAPIIADLPATSTINCPATPVFAVATATDACGSAFTLTSADVTTPGACAGSYSVKRTWTATDACGNTSTASQIINVVDNTAPVIAALPATSTINCPATPVFAVATATDGCGSAFTLTSADVTTPGACAGSYSVKRTWTATDACGNTSTASQIINVVDNTAPVIAALPATSTINCPATPVFAVATATDGCGSAFTLTSADVTTPGACTGSYSVKRTWTATDACGNTSTASQIINVEDNTPPLISSLISPLPEAGLYAVGIPAKLTATFSDACSVASLVVNWDDPTSPSNVTTVPNPSSSTTVQHAYAAAGVYSPTVTVSDGCNSVTLTYQYVVIYDPNAGFVTGGGWINSPAGAYAANPLLSGKAHFGFNAKYKKGQSVPTGETEFQFQVGNVNFHSTAYQWLVVAGAKAQYKGTGTLNGVAGYAFMLTATDGQINGAGNVDKFRIKITNGSSTVYDNVPSASDDIDTANPQDIGGGSIVIQSK